MKLTVDGVEGEYFTPEEVAAKQAEALQTKADEFKAREKDIEDLQNPNIKVLRDKAKRLEEFEKTGKRVGEKGEVIDEPKPFSKDDAVAVAHQEMLNDRKEEILDSIDKEKREVVQHYYDKLTAGEEVNMKNMKEFISAAARMAEVDMPNENFNRYAAGRGGAPEVSFNDKKENFADTDKGKNMAGMLGINI